MNNSTTSKYYPAKELLEDLYINQRLSPDEIAKQFGVSGRTIRTRMKEYNIPRLGATHLRKGKVAIWNVGIKRSQESKEKNRQAHVGKTAYNKGNGDIERVCEVCQIKYITKVWRNKRTCSKECKNQLSHIYRGKSHWNYKGDNSNTKQRQRLWVEYKEWKKAVISQANRTCLKCGNQNNKLEAHHIYSWAYYPEKRFDISNGACLCKDCHREFHCIYGQKKSKPEHFVLWLFTTSSD